MSATRSRPGALWPTPRWKCAPVKGKPGSYEAVAYLRPHYQLETLSTSMRLVAEVPKKL